MKITRTKKVIALLGALVLVCFTLTFFLFLHPPGPQIECHRAIDGAFQQWKFVTTNDLWYPNIEGSSAKSLETIAAYFDPNDSNALCDYRYVPGLKSDDSSDLILMYVKEPSRRNWHGDTHYFRKEKRWIVLNPAMDDGEDDKWSEVGEWISTTEFTNRLTKTLRFLSENQRPYWTNAINEHSEFFKSLQK